MEINNASLMELLKFQFRRSITNLYKNFLSSAEDLKIKGQINDLDYQIIRKRILDNGNDSIRELEETLDNFIKLIDNKKD